MFSTLFGGTPVQDYIMMAAGDPARRIVEHARVQDIAFVWAWMVNSSSAEGFVNGQQCLQVKLHVACRGRDSSSASQFIIPIRFSVDCRHDRSTTLCT